MIYFGKDTVLYLQFFVVLVIVGVVQIDAVISIVLNIISVYETLLLRFLSTAVYGQFSALMEIVCPV